MTIFEIGSVSSEQCTISTRSFEASRKKLARPFFYRDPMCSQDGASIVYYIIAKATAGTQSSNKYAEDTQIPILYSKFGVALAPAGCTLGKI
jgi:hypothetical protein